MQLLNQIAIACRGGRLCPPQTTLAYTGATTEGRPYMQWPITLNLLSCSGACRFVQQLSLTKIAGAWVALLFIWATVADAASLHLKPVQAAHPQSAIARSKS